MDGVKKGILINVSGGAIRFVYLAYAFYNLLLKGVSPTAVSGVSAGSFIVFAFCCGRLREALDIANKTHDPRQIFSKKNQPFGKISGFSISALIKIVSGKGYAGVMDNLEKNLRKTISEEDFEEYQQDNNRPDCFIMCINEETHSEVLINLKDSRVKYEDAINIVMGSAAISPTTKPYKLRSDLIHPLNTGSVILIDGGHRHVSAGSYVLENELAGDLNECYTILSRNSKDQYNSVSKQNVKSFFNRLLNITSIFVREVSINDEYKEIEECRKRGVKHFNIYCGFPVVSTYEITENQVSLAPKLAREAVNEALYN